VLTAWIQRDIHHCINTAWLSGAVDMPRWIAFKTGDPDGFKSFMERGRAACGGLFERPFVSWKKPTSGYQMSATHPAGRSD